MPISVLLVDDHAIFRAGLRSLVSEEPDIVIVGEAEDGQTAIRRAQELEPDLVVMDIGLPDIDGIEATRQIKAQVPNTKVLALSIHSESHFVIEMLRAGAAGYLLKESVPEELLAGIRTVASGEGALSAAIQDVVISQYVRLLAHETDSELAANDESAPDKDHGFEVLNTKLYQPRVSARAVPRERLWATLDEGLSQSLILVSAPAGYGKSTLVSQWLAARAHPSAWISLDERDNDLRIFLTYFITATQARFPESLAQSAALIQAPTLPASTVLAKILINELAQISQHFVLVLDDYHRIDTPDVHELLREILHHPPPTLHLLLVTRRDPPLDLLRLRAYGKMVEVRAQALRFTAAEIAEFLQQKLGTPTQGALVAALMAKTEGWVTGLHLITLSARDHAALADIARVLPGEQQSLDYLVAEALTRQPRDIQTWLLTTSMLDQFCASLCDAICAPTDDESSNLNGEEFIRWLEEHNLFMIPLDHRGQWFRYHHLFQQVLQSQLEHTLAPDEITALHMRASDWFAAHGMINDALEHALAAGDIVAAAELVEAHSHAELASERWYVVEQWLAMLPEEIKQARPRLLLVQAWVEYSHFRLERIPPLIERAAPLLDADDVDPVRLAELDFFQGNFLYWTGQAEASVHYLEQALAQASGKSRHVETNIEVILNLAYSMNGQKEKAIQGINERIRDVDTSQAQFLTYRLGGLAFIHTLAGELPQARAAGKRLFSAATRAHIDNSAAWGTYTQGCSYLQLGEFERAREQLAIAAQQRYILDSNAVLDSLAGLALAEQFMGHEDAADEALVQLSDFAHVIDDPYCFAIARSAQARLDLLRGDLASAAQWALATDAIIAPSTLFLWLEVPATTQARVLIAIGSKESLHKATELLGEVHKQSEACHFTNHRIEAMTLQALAEKKLGDQGEALRILRAVLTLAGSNGWIRPFVEAGKPMADLLRGVQRQSCAADIAPTSAQILAAFPDIAPPSAQPGLMEPLTERELQIIRLLATEMPAKELADHLVVSVTTVRAHVRNIYGKLNVHSRYEAVQHARELGII